MFRDRLLRLDQIIWGLIAAFWLLEFAVGAALERARPVLFALGPSTLVRLGALRGPLSSVGELLRVLEKSKPEWIFPSICCSQQSCALVTRRRGSA